MNLGGGRFQAKILKPAKSEAEYDIYKASLEWDLIEPIVIEDATDLKSEKKWMNTVQPFNHQVTNLMSFCRRLPVTLLADDVGLGKTISAGLIISELMARGRISKILIVCPKILRQQWKEELKTKFGLQAIIAQGRELIDAEPPEGVGAVITTYHSARLYLDKISDTGYDMLILDEAHKLRNLYGVEHTPLVATKFRKALADRLFRYVLMLTATPIQNRLWDLYSLVELLTVARGHENPFGTPGVFARKFIADNRNSARQIRPEAQAEFRDIVYGYMSRIRRADTNLEFPERVVELRAVEPTIEEKNLIQVVIDGIQVLPRLVQIGILQVLVSSPEALVSWITGMARRGTAPEELAMQVKEAANQIKETSKLRGLAALIEKLKAENPEHWRLVIFTRWRETQTSIQIFLESQGISHGLINGDSAEKNQEAIERFKEAVPDAHVIISTEAGSEGVNLQIANVLLNWDLPWNPMIVEQRIGRIQRLNSKFAKVVIVNIILKGTFEEIVVGRLMEKLQLATHAIGDIEALLDATGMDDGDDDSLSFEEKIRELVLLSLKGQDTEAALLKFEKSMAEAKERLEEEQKNITTLLGDPSAFSDQGPAAPHLPSVEKSMKLEDFVLNILRGSGWQLYERSTNQYLGKKDGVEEHIVIGDLPEKVDTQNLRLAQYNPGSPAFARLVGGISNNALSLLQNLDDKINLDITAKIKNWLNSFQGVLVTEREKESKVFFKGKILLKVKAIVAHDSYERLIDIEWSSDEKKGIKSKGFSQYVDDVTALGVDVEELMAMARNDAGISEFCRFYLERLNQELGAVGNDARKKKKIEDDFTPRLEFVLLGLKGSVYKKIQCVVDYKVASGSQIYQSFLSIVPIREEVVEAPLFDKCEKTQLLVPVDCIDVSDLSSKKALKEFFLKSDVSDRKGLEDELVICEFSGKKVLMDEVQKSDVTNKLVLKEVLRTSMVSGKKAEPNLFSRCEFTNDLALETELAISQISSKKYRVDEEVVSSVSGKRGHRQEFIKCAETGQYLLQSESERCELTGKVVMPSTLEKCEVSGKKVIPTELLVSAFSRKKALKKYFVFSSISNVPLLEEEATISSKGKYCLPSEARECVWSGKLSHPEDLKRCSLTGEMFHQDYIQDNVFKILKSLLDGTERHVDVPDKWNAISQKTAQALRSKNYQVESAEISPNGKYLAVCLEQRLMLGFKKKHIGLLYSLENDAIKGMVAIGKREAIGWNKIEN